MKIMPLLADVQTRLGLRSAETSSNAGTNWNLNTILIGLIVPAAMTILNMSMFGVAIPFIRDSFQIDADLVAWLVTAYTLPFVVFMPLYGRLGDGLGKRRLFTVGIVVFLVGTILCVMAQDLRWLMIGRVVQGIGTSGINPLCIAIISEIFPDNQRGRALGTWSATGPAIGMIGPFLGGFLVDQWGWHSIFVPGILAALVALYVVRGQIPALRPKPQPGFLRTFDWIGVLLLSGAIISLICYLSSRLITGVESLRDWRLALLTLAFVVSFLWWEQYYYNPLVPLALFRTGNLGRASLVATCRMFLMSSESFLMPLYLTDIHQLNATWLGVMIMIHSGSLLLTVRRGGQIADRGKSRLAVIVGLSLQVSVMLYYIMLPGTVSIWAVAAGLMVHGASAGLSLAVLPRIALAAIPPHMSGSAAGLFSTSRFFGSIMGTTLGGVVVQQTLEYSGVALSAYRLGFLLLAIMGCIGLITIWGVREQKVAG